MTPIQEIIREMRELRAYALEGDDAARIRLANLVIGSWSTVLRALTALDERNANA